MLSTRPISAGSAQPQTLLTHVPRKFFINLGKNIVAVNNVRTNITVW